MPSLLNLLLLLVRRVRMYHHLLLCINVYSIAPVLINFHAFPKTSNFRSDIFSHAASDSRILDCLTACILPQCCVHMIIYMRINSKIYSFLRKPPENVFQPISENPHRFLNLESRAKYFYMFCQILETKIFGTSSTKERTRMFIT